MLFHVSRFVFLGIFYRCFIDSQDLTRRLTISFFPDRNRFFSYLRQLRPRVLYGNNVASTDWFWRIISSCVTDLGPWGTAGSHTVVKVFIATHAGSMDITRCFCFPFCSMDCPFHLQIPESERLLFKERERKERKKRRKIIHLQSKYADSPLPWYIDILGVGSPHARITRGWCSNSFFSVILHV